VKCSVVRNVTVADRGSSSIPADPGSVVAFSPCARRLTVARPPVGFFKAGRKVAHKAVAEVAHTLGVEATIFLPEWVSAERADAVARTGARLVLEGETYDEAERAARAAASEGGLTFIHPFDDPEVIAGQATVGREVLGQLSLVDTVVAPVSGGGLVSGIALAIKAAKPNVRIIGASAERAASMARSVAAGRPISPPEGETLASVLLGGVGERNRYTLRLVRALVDELPLVNEEEIARAVRFAVSAHRLIVDGGGAWWLLRH
jgi:threonine dehydratase